MDVQTSYWNIEHELTVFVGGCTVGCLTSSFVAQDVTYFMSERQPLIVRVDNGEFSRLESLILSPGNGAGHLTHSDDDEEVDMNDEIEDLRLMKILKG